MMGGILLLAGFAKLAEVTGKPAHCAAVYAAVILLLGVLFGEPAIGVMAIEGAAAFVGAWVLFALLNRFQDDLLLWVVALLVGLFVMYAAGQMLDSLLAR